MTTHPFTASGMGDAPFSFVGVFCIPDLSLLAQNPTAYNRAMAEMPRDAHCGTCAHCGMGIMANYIVQSSDGRRASVGCECIRKLNGADARLETAAKKAKLAIDRTKRRQRTDAQRAARAEKWREENAAQIAAQTAKKDAAREIIRAQWAFVVPFLRASGPWANTIASQIEEGQPPRGRGVEIVREIFAKCAGRKGSKAYDAAVARFDAGIA